MKWMLLILFTDGEPVTIPMQDEVVCNQAATQVLIESMQEDLFPKVYCLRTSFGEA